MLLVIGRWCAYMRVCVCVCAVHEYSTDMSISVRSLIQVLSHNFHCGADAHICRRVIGCRRVSGRRQFEALVWQTGSGVVYKW